MFILSLVYQQAREDTRRHPIPKVRKGTYASELSVVKDRFLMLYMVHGVQRMPERCRTVQSAGTLTANNDGQFLYMLRFRMPLIQMGCFECGSVTLLSLVLSIRVMLEILVETTV
jgi:hypothetical protein